MSVDSWKCFRYLGQYMADAIKHRPFHVNIVSAFRFRISILKISKVVSNCWYVVKNWNANVITIPVYTNSIIMTLSLRAVDENIWKQTKECLEKHFENNFNIFISKMNQSKIFLGSK